MRTFKCLWSPLVLLIVLLEVHHAWINASESSVEDSVKGHVDELDSTTLDTTKEETRVDEPTEPTSSPTVTLESIYHQDAEFTAVEANENEDIKRSGSGNTHEFDDDGRRILNIINTFLKNHSSNQGVAYEGFLEMMAIVAANPEQWHRVKEIWEKHSHANTKSSKIGREQQAEATIKTKGTKPKLKEKTIQDANSVLPKGVPTVTGKPERSSRRKNQHRPPLQAQSSRDPSTPEPLVDKDLQKNSPHRHHHHKGKPKGDFAIERPVTVIGERSQVDPVEQELVEAAANRRFKTLERVKQGNSANAEEDVEQLHTLNKLALRYKQHRLQKEKLQQKLRNRPMEVKIPVRV